MSVFELSGRRALVTGGARGLGQGMAEALARAGASVMIGDVLDELATETAQLLAKDGATVSSTHLDITDEASWEAAIAATVAELGGFDVLVNNAGVEVTQLVVDIDPAQLRRMLEVNVLGTALGMKHGLRAMRPGGAAGQGGSIVNVASVAAYLPRGTYSAAKAYVVSLSEWADLTYRDRGVHVMALLPGFTRTEFHDRMQVSQASAPRWMWLDADRLVDEALRDLERGRRISIPSRRYKVLAAAARYTPSTLQARLQGLGRK
jgi:NAD(P)-dependent dehydrogenase (short-subunit alcohol dehydrogenase family)